MDSVDILRGVLILFAAAALVYLALEYANKQKQNDEGFIADFVDANKKLTDNHNKKSTIAPSTASNAQASEPLSNDSYKPITNQHTQLPKDCFPKDKLTAEDLLPKDSANSKWAQVNPAGQGDVKDQNFLNAGFHVGINTVGTSLRNPNMQLRSEPPNPQVKVSPWNQTTIESDLNRRPLEIGGCE
jgi:hypothetical protein